MNVRKRSGKVVPFDAGFIHRAISLASAAAGEQDEAAIDTMTKTVTDKLEAMGKEIIDIEKIQDTVEETLFQQMHYQTAKAYILYRMEKEKERTGGTWKEGLLSREFLSPYKHQPNPMGQLGAFVYTRTYSRFLPRLGRREFWWETVRRAVEYNCSLAPTSREEAEKLYDNIYHLRQFLSGRTLWVGGTPVAEQYPMANYNCAFTVIDDFSAYHDLFYLLMVGSGLRLHRHRRLLRLPRPLLPPDGGQRRGRAGAPERRGQAPAGAYRPGDPPQVLRCQEARRPPGVYRPHLHPGHGHHGHRRLQGGLGAGAAALL